MCGAVLPAEQAREGETRIPALRGLAVWRGQEGDCRLCLVQSEGAAQGRGVMSEGSTKWGLGWSKVHRKPVVPHRAVRRALDLGGRRGSRGHTGTDPPATCRAWILLCR